MDVILLKDIEKIGAEGTVVRVKPGFARNYLVPRGLAAPATAQQLKLYEEAKRRRLQQAQRATEQAGTLKRTLESRSLTLKLRLGADDKPFGAITSHDVLEVLRQDGTELDKHAVHLPQPIKTLGVFEIPVRLHPEVTATVKLWVVKE